LHDCVKFFLPLGTKAKLRDWTILVPSLVPRPHLLGRLRSVLLTTNATRRDVCSQENGTLRETYETAWEPERGSVRARQQHVHVLIKRFTRLRIRKVS